MWGTQKKKNTNSNFHHPSQARSMLVPSLSTFADSSAPAAAHSLSPPTTPPAPSPLPSQCQNHVTDWRISTQENFEMTQSTSSSGDGHSPHTRSIRVYIKNGRAFAYKGKLIAWRKTSQTSFAFSPPCTKPTCHIAPWKLPEVPFLNCSLLDALQLKENQTVPPSRLTLRVQALRAQLLLQRWEWKKVKKPESGGEWGGGGGSGCIRPPAGSKGKAPWNWRLFQHLRYENPHFLALYSVSNSSSRNTLYCALRLSSRGTNHA